MPHLLRFPLLLLILLFLCLQVGAQHIFRGKVMGKGNEAIPFAIIQLQNQGDSSFVMGDVADSSGAFSLNIAAGKNLIAVFSMAGYKSQSMIISQYDTAAHTIILSASDHLLEDVTILSRKALIERKADRTVFNVASSITSIGSDAYDVLKKAPGVQVSNDNIGIVGKSSVSIMLNDRLVQVSGDELESMLRSIPAADISKIEIITAPPSKYDAEGNSGIINIVSKKSINNGLNGNITLTYQQRTKASQQIHGNFNYRNGKLNVYGNSNVNRLTFISEQKINTQYPEQQQLQVLNQNNRPLYTYSQLGADYNLSPNAVLGFIYTLGSMDTKRDEVIATQALHVPSLALDSTMMTNAFATDKGRRHVFNLNYDWKIDSAGKKLSVNGDYFTRKGSNTRNFTTGNLYADGTGTGNISDNRTQGQLNTDIGTIRADLEWPTALADISGGAKASWIHTYSDNIFRYLSGNDYVNDAGKTNSFDYKENTQALYANAKKDWGKWNAQIGLRAEYTQTRGQSLTLGQVNTNNYFKLFPSAYLQYKPNDDHSWNINYTRRINRPSFWDMNPFRVYSTATAYEEGNPFLQPSFSNNIEVGYAYKSVLAFTAFVQKVDAYATRVSFVDTVNNFFYFRKANAGNELQCGITASLTFSPTPWWESSNNLYGTFNKFSSDFYPDAISYAKPSFSIETNNSFILNKPQTLLAEINFEYNGRRQDDFDTRYSSCNLSAGIKALVFNKRMTISLDAEDILKTDIWQMRNDYNGTYQRSYFDSREVNLSFSWKFGNQFIKEKRQRNTGSEEAGRAN